jgi:hypothetical protein
VVLGEKVDVKRHKEFARRAMDFRTGQVESEGGKSRDKKMMVKLIV